MIVRCYGCGKPLRKGQKGDPKRIYCTLECKRNPVNWKRVEKIKKRAAKKQKPKPKPKRPKKPKPWWHGERKRCKQCNKLFGVPKYLHRYKTPHNTWRNRQFCSQECGGKYWGRRRYMFSES